MAKRYFFLFGLVGIFVISVNCAGPSRVEMDYGTSYKLAKFGQILNPGAEKNLEPVSGFDGRAAEATKERYRQGFQERIQAPVYNLSIGGK